MIDRSSGGDLHIAASYSGGYNSVKGHTSDVLGSTRIKNLQPAFQDLESSTQLGIPHGTKPLPWDKHV